MKRRRLGSAGLWTVLGILLFWQALAWLHLTDAELSGSPLGILGAGWHFMQTRNILPNLASTGAEFVEGMLLSVVTGVPLGLLLGRRARLRASLDPLLMALYAAPRAALLPMLIVWLGIGAGSKVACVFVGGFFPLLLNTIAGIVDVDPSLVRAAESFGITGWQAFRNVLLPAALPEMLSGLRLGLGHGLVGVIVAEMYVNQGGVGQLLMLAQQGLNVDLLMFFAFVFTVFGVLFIYAVNWYQRRYVSWWESSRS